MIDLHLHSSHSDGVLAPAEVVALAAANGVRLMALTDHDTTSGVEAAGRAADREGIRLVAGAEISSSWSGRAIHILALAIDPACEALRSGLEETQRLRRTRARAIADRLRRHGLPGDELFGIATSCSEVITRTHLARAMVDRGIVRDASAAYAEWLGQGRPGHVAAQFRPLGEVVGWIRAAGGHAVIAHPLRYRLSSGQRRHLLADFKAAGGAGIEVVTGGHSPTQVEAATGLALRAGLCGSVGSDFHDPAIPWNPPGRLANLPASVSPIWLQPGFAPGS